MYDHIHVVEFLLQKGARPDSVSNTGITPLLAAATFGAHNTVRLLLSHKVDCLKAEDTGANVVHCAVGHIATLKVLAEVNTY
jgi:ankyrin repeat protein